MPGDRGGFSLIELMVVVATLALAVAIAIPRYVQNERGQRQAECPAALRQLNEAQSSFFRAHGRYAREVGELSWSPPAHPPYRYFFTEVSDRSYIASCVANLDEDTALDQFTIDQNGKLTQLSNDLE